MDSKMQQDLFGFLKHWVQVRKTKRKHSMPERKWREMAARNRHKVRLLRKLLVGM